MFAKNRHLIKLNKGQCVVEYLVFFTVITILTLLSICAFYPRIHQAGETAFQEAVEEILQ